MRILALFLALLLSAPVSASTLDFATPGWSLPHRWGPDNHRSRFLGAAAVRDLSPPGWLRRPARDFDAWKARVEEKRLAWREAVRDWVHRDGLTSGCTCPPDNGSAPPTAVPGVPLPAAAPALALSLLVLAAYVRRGAWKRRVGRRRMLPLHRF